MKKIKNYLTDEYVLIAPKRLGRPYDYKTSNKIEISSNKYCPFCEHNFQYLENILYKNESGSCMILKNKYPAVDGVNSSHEVVIDSKKHDISFSELDVDDMIEVIKAIIIRENHIYENENIKHIQIFKNSGYNAGASLQHSHMQIIALDYVPKKFVTISENMSKYKHSTNECYICSLTEGEDVFTFYENEWVRAVAKHDTIMSQTVDIIPKRHFKSIVEMVDTDIKGICLAIKMTIYLMNKLIDNLNYNIVFYSSPKIDGQFNNDFHFFVQIVPRIFGFAGFEVGTGCFINSTIAKDYCEELKKISIDT